MLACVIIVLSFRFGKLAAVSPQLDAHTALPYHAT